MNPTKKLRRQLRLRRRALSIREQRHHAIAVARHLVHYRHFRQARRIAAYWAADGELNLAPVIAQALTRGQRIYLPVVKQHPSSRSAGRLLFAEYTAKQRLRRNRFGIPEPVGHCRQYVTARQLDLVLLPLVGFDTNRNRIGMGGGFYDRAFAYRQRNMAGLPPRLVGIAHTCQHLASIDARAWDIRPDAICTEAAGTWNRRHHLRSTGQTINHNP